MSAKKKWEKCKDAKFNWKKFFVEKFGFSLKKIYVLNFYGFDWYFVETKFSSQKHEINVVKDKINEEKLQTKFFCLQEFHV